MYKSVFMYICICNIHIYLYIYTYSCMYVYVYMHVYKYRLPSLSLYLSNPHLSASIHTKTTHTHTTPTSIYTHTHTQAHLYTLTPTPTHITTLPQSHHLPPYSPTPTHPHIVTHTPMHSTRKALAGDGGREGGSMMIGWAWRKVEQWLLRWRRVRCCCMSRIDVCLYMSYFIGWSHAYFYICCTSSAEMMTCVVQQCVVYLFMFTYSVHFCWWVLQHCTGFARLVWGRLRVRRAFNYSC